MAIEDRNLKAGSTLAARFKGKTYTAEVVQTDDGIRYRVPEKGDFKSLSSAGKAVTNGAVNGWKFWSLADKEDEPVDRVRPAAEPRAAKTKTVVQIRKRPNQRGVPEGEVKYYCSACQKSFVLLAGEAPSTCPDGHPREAEDELALEE